MKTKAIMGVVLLLATAVCMKEYCLADGTSPSASPTYGSTQTTNISYTVVPYSVLSIANNPTAIITPVVAPNGTVTFTTNEDSSSNFNFGVNGTILSNDPKGVDITVTSGNTADAGTSKFTAVNGTNTLIWDLAPMLINAATFTKQTPNEVTTSNNNNNQSFTQYANFESSSLTGATPSGNYNGTLTYTITSNL